MTAAAQSEETPRGPGLLRRAPVLLWIVGQGASVLGDAAFYTSLTWAALQASNAGAAGIVLGVGAAPRVFALLLGGALTDRCGPRRVMMAADAARALIMVVAAGAAAQQQLSIAALLAIALLFGVFDGLFQPGVGALPPLIASPGELVRLQGVRGFVNRVAAVGGAPLGGLLIASQGVHASFALNAATFAASFAAIGAIRLPRTVTRHSDEVRRGVASSSRAALQFVRRTPSLARLLLLILFLEFALSGTTNVGLAVLAEQQAWGASGFGLMGGAIAAGALCSSLWLATSSAAASRPTLMPRSAFLIAGSLCLLPLVPLLALALLLSAVVGAAAGVVTVLAFAMLQTTAPPAMLGRVTALVGVATMGAAPLSLALTGLLAHRSVTWALLVNASLAGVGALVARRGQLT
jgi:uncharacterized integral membrane protein